MEEFKLPLREIKEKFTSSELILLAWRSQEQHWNFKKQTDKYKDPDKQGKGKRKIYGADEIGPHGLPDRFFNEDGEVDLRQVSGEEARQYMELRLGLPFPPGISKIRDESPEAQAVRNAYGVK